MKKIYLITTLLLSLNSYCQVNNLKDLLYLSQLTNYGLIETLQGRWELVRPTEKTVNEGEQKIIIGVYPYVYKGDEINQTIKRQINLLVGTSIRIEKTEFICNDKELYNRILKNLPNEGFYLKQKKPHSLFYHDGNFGIGVTDDAYKDAPLKQGYYMITIFM